MHDNPYGRHNDAGPLIASLPSFLGFTPDRSLVLLTDGPDGTTVLRLDLTYLTASQSSTKADAQFDVAAVRSLARRVQLMKTATCLLVVVSGPAAPAASTAPAGPSSTPSSPSGADLPYRRLAEAMRDDLGRLGVPVLHMAVVPEVRDGAAWSCYDDPGCRGAVPDPKATRSAAATVLAGHVIYPDRETLLQEMLPAPDPTGMARRETALAQLDGRGAAWGLRALRAAVARGRTGSLTTEDETVALLAALRRPDVLDQALAIVSAAPDRLLLERIWHHSTAQAPESHRPGPAALLAFSAYLRGDGVIARAAVDIARSSQPEHRFAAVLDVALSLAIPPEELQRLTEIVTQPDPDTPPRRRANGD